jgi:hypothetical protein
MLKQYAANRKRRLSALPNVGPNIYDVQISGFADPDAPNSVNSDPHNGCRYEPYRLTVLCKQNAASVPLKIISIIRRWEVTVMLRTLYSEGGAFRCPLNRRLRQPQCRFWRGAKKETVCLRQKSTPNSPAVRTVTYETFWLGKRITKPIRKTVITY